jgi:hypothetical protein
MSSESTSRIQQLIKLIASSLAGQPLTRAFFQLNDDLSRTSAEQLQEVGASAELPEDQTRAALVAAALSYRYDELGQAEPSWLSDVSSPEPVYLTSGLNELTRQRTPDVVGRHNVWVDAASFHSI